MEGILSFFITISDQAAVIGLLFGMAFAVLGSAIRLNWQFPQDSTPRKTPWFKIIAIAVLFSSCMYVFIALGTAIQRGQQAISYCRTLPDSCNLDLESFKSSSTSSAKTD